LRKKREKVNKNNNFKSKDKLTLGLHFYNRQKRDPVKASNWGFKTCILPRRVGREAAWRGRERERRLIYGRREKLGMRTEQANEREVL
jgi:hypothetical protein